ncbi:signal peptidase I [Aequorivita echinoideorum]|uniref:Signal peptidase I n=1 Tax=Aequorivita echinoideorum TaxID=1549647 RepID=A0ABS5S7K1_9FLAO|nr:signal peptidase I [Aequorivita echinoideorum]MBT0609188.1 signal peptidase I [Aequorivita echinoideorum]
MSWTGWFIFFLIVQVIHFAGTWKLYQIAGRKVWEAAVPVYNAVVLMRIINRPWWWTVLLFIPIVNLIMFPVIWVETLRSFGRNSTTDTLLVIITLGFYIYYVNYTQKVSHLPERSLKPRTSAGEWVSSILFAVVAATIVHGYVMQPFTIPTSSLEKTLLIGDFLFVSKFHYGARPPMTPVAFPMVHDTIPVINKKSYLTKPQIPYFRFPGFQDIERNDIVVFNWPVDTVNAFQQYGDGKYYYKPIDKKSNYVKRCVGLPGDSLEVRDGYVFINGKQNQLPDRAKIQFSYEIKTNGPLNPELLQNRYNITDRYGYESNTYRFAAISDESLALLKNNPNVVEISKLHSTKGQWDTGIFPNNMNYPWNNDFFGPLYIPKKGAAVEITQQTIPLYKRVIEVYEGSELGIDNKITQSGTQVLLNGQPITEYTFKQNYYWMMGDNRNNSEDARTWGFVPFNHVVGKPVFIWASWDNLTGSVRWDRVFTTVGGSGQPVSYLLYFIILVIAYLVFDFIRKRRKTT